MKYIYLLFFTLFYFSGSSACTVEEALNRHAPRLPVAKRLLKATENLPDTQDTRPLKKSPGYQAPTLQDERIRILCENALP